MRSLAFLPVVGALAPSVALADTPLGSIVENGIVVEVNEEGFSMVTDMVADLIPPEIPVEDFSSHDQIACTFGSCLYRYDIQTRGMWIAVTPEISIIPGTDTLSMHADVVVNVNSPADPAFVDLFFELIYVDWVDERCTLYMDPINLTFDVPISMHLLPDPYGADIDGDGTPDTKRMDVSIPTPVWNWDADSDDFNFGGCNTASVLDFTNSLTKYFGLDFYQLILDSMVPVIDEVVASIPEQVEPVIEDLFTELTISEVIDLGVPLEFSIWPDSISITPEVPDPPTPGAMRIGLASAIDVPVHPCVADYVTGGAKTTPSNPPPIGDDGGVSFPPQVAAFVDDDFANYFLYGIWAGGMLCYEIRSDDPTLELPIPIDTTLLGIIAPDPSVPGSSYFTKFFPEPVPMSIVTDPKAAPVVDPSGPNDLDVVADDLGLDFVAEIDGRRARLFQANLNAVAGVNVVFDPVYGNTNFTIDMDAESFTANVTYNDLVPAASDPIGNQFSALFDILIEPMIADIASSLFFPPTTFEGIGLLQLETAQTGPEGDWLGAYTQVGEVPYYAAGCEPKKGYGGYYYKGCDTKSCSYGCSSGGGNFAFLGFPLVVAALRRRRQR